MIFERDDGVGGTWRANTYPGAACDVPSHLYSLSFAPNPHWSSGVRRAAGDPRVRRGLLRPLRRPPQGAHRHERRVRHLVRRRQPLACSPTRTATSTRPRVLVSAMGMFNTPSIPADAGPRRLRRDHVPLGALGPRPRPDRPAGGRRRHRRQRDPGRPGDRRAHRPPRRVPAHRAVDPPAPRRAVHATEQQRSSPTQPEVARRHRQELYDLFERTTAFVAGDPSVEVITGDRPRTTSSTRSPDPDLRARLTPGQPFGCKRTLISSDYSGACSATTSIWSPRHRADHRRRDPHGRRRRATGRHDRAVHRASAPATTCAASTWSAATAPTSTTLGRGAPGLPRHRRARVPQLLHALRPEHQPGRQLDPPHPRGPGAVRGDRARGHGRGRGARPSRSTAEAMARYAAELERDLAATVWTNGCSSYFHNAAGDIVTQLPHTSGWYRDATAADRPSRLHLRRCHVHDLVIRGGTVVDGTGAPARTADVAVTGRHHHRGGAGRRPGPPEVDADGLLVTPRLRRRPHPLRRPGHLGRRPHAVVLARRHHRRAGQLRRGLRPGAPRRPGRADRADGGRRGHPRRRAVRGHPVGLGDVPRVPRRPRPAPRWPSTSAPTSPMPPCAPT